MRSSHWTYNDRLRELLAAQWWGCPTPEDFHSLPKQARLEIVAAYEADWRMNAINAHEAARPKKRG